MENLATGGKLSESSEIEYQKKLEIQQEQIDELKI